MINRGRPLAVAASMRRVVAATVLAAALAALTVTPAAAEPATTLSYPTNASATRLTGSAFDACTAPSLATMLIQTDKFGTSVAQSLRVHCETLRTKRRQRAEEAAAKTGVKMVFPLVFCIFPAVWIVTIGPAAIKFVQVIVPIAQDIKKH